MFGAFNSTIKLLVLRLLAQAAGEFREHRRSVCGLLRNLVGFNWLQMRIMNGGDNHDEVHMTTVGFTVFTLCLENFPKVAAIRVAKSVIESFIEVK